MNIEDLTYGELKSIAAMFSTPSNPPSPHVKYGIKIVVLDRGFVYVGDVTITDEFVIIERASNIRVWGTSKGLGELVNGPLSGTKLDATGTVQVNRKALISLVSVEEKSWKSKL